MVEDALAQAKAETKAEPEKKLFKPISQEEQWKKIMEEPDPLQDQDIYAGERKKECEEKAPPTAEDLEYEDDLTDVLTQSFNKEKKKSNFVNNIPEILTQKKDENFNKMFSGVTEQDLERMDI